MNQKSKKKAPVVPVRTLGPVNDLEGHLKPDWWRFLFNALYLKTDGDVVENDQNTKTEIDAVLEFAGLHPNQAVCDLCCGQGRHLLELADRGFTNLYGVDRSRYLVQLARKRAAKKGVSISFSEGDARKFGKPGQTFDAVMMMGNSFGYFEQPMDDHKVLQRIASQLAPDGKLILDLVDGSWMKTHFEARTWEWIDPSHFVCRERGLAKDGSRLISREVITHAERGVLADQFYAERLYERPELEALLDEIGYRDVAFHRVLEADSDRKQDLGMMARRVLITATAPKEREKTVFWTGPRNVMVIMGDNQLPDKVKLGGKFNAEDLETQDRLKRALGDLKDYRFTYMERHQNMINTLINSKPALVLNFCDEGYGNDPRKELHVPAMMEMLDIPYTGAGPASLAMCYNKFYVNAVASGLNIPTPRQTLVTVDAPAASLPTTFPALIKPNQGDGSMGITNRALVWNMEELMSYLDWIRTTYGPQQILIQEFLSGPEYSLGLIGNPGPGFHFMPILEVDYSGLHEGSTPILAYESKWDPNSDHWKNIRYQPAELPEETVRTIQDYASILFEMTGCRDYARIDFRTDADGVIKLLEVNPNPGWCWDGKFNMMAEWMGWSYDRFLEAILAAAEKRLSTK